MIYFMLLIRVSICLILLKSCGPLIVLSSVVKAEMQSKIFFSEDHENKNIIAKDWFDFEVS